MIRNVLGSRLREVGAAGRAAEVTPPTPGPSGKLDVEACYRYCEALARAHHHNFPVASLFLPSRLRPHVLALYAFARAADDFADEPRWAGRRAEELDRWEDLLHRCFHGEVDHPIFVALGETAARFDLPITPFVDLLSAFRMDLRTRRYATWRELMGYATMAARPIGQVMLYVFGYRDVERHRYAEELSTALALTSFWQDIARDLGRDRIYVPQEDLKHFGVAEEDLFARRESPALAALCRSEVARTRAVFERARPLVDLVDDDLGVEIALVWHGGWRALRKIEKAAGRVFGPRVTLSPLDKARALGHALARRGTGLLSRI